MATKVKPSRIHATWTPQNWQVLSYVSPDTFQWTNWGGGGWWDMYYNNFNWVTKTWSSFDLDLSSKYVPTWDFTVNAPATIKDWQTYLLRVDNWATAYTMSLWTWITNLQWTDITLTPNATDMFVFLAINWELELQKEIKAWWIFYFFLNDETDQTELDNLWAWYNTLPNDPDEFDNSVIIIDYWNGSWQYPNYSPSWRYYYKSQDSQDMYFFCDNYTLKVQFTMQWWYTRTGVYSVTILTNYTAGTGINLIGGHEIECTLTWVPSGWTTGQVLTMTSGWIAWQAAAWDVKYEDFETATVVWATLTISYFTTQITPSANFTLVAGTVKEWMQYIVRVNSWATAYTMSLGTWVTNPFGEDLTLTASKTTTVVLLATSSSTLEIFSIRTAE